MRLHLIDGTYELFRAHFSPRPSRTDPQGRNVKAAHGLASTLIALLNDHDEQVTHCAIAFDHPIESFRNELFDGYKDGSGVEPALLAQFDLAERVATALGLTVWSMDTYEADDALATAAVNFSGDFEQVRILTPDKDLGQVVSATRIVQVDRSRGTVIDEEAVHARLGVAPPSVPDLLALVGDTADGIPGLPGFGAKSTATLLAHYRHLDQIPDDATTWQVNVRGAARLAVTLRQLREEALLYRRLATLVTDVALETTVDELHYRGADPTGWQQLCTELDWESLADRPRQWA